MRYIGYVRVSTPDQVKEGVSLDAQRDRIVAWCTAQDYELVRVEVDEGVSGAKPPGYGKSQRPGLQNALQWLENGDADGLIVYKLDRLSRKLKYMLEVAESFDAKGWTLVSVSESLDTKSANGRFFFKMLAAMAEWEREILSERVTEGMAKVKRNGGRVGRHATYGFRLVDGVQVVDANEQEMIDAIKFRRHWKPKEIVNWINLLSLYRDRKWTTRDVERVLGQAK